MNSIFFDSLANYGERIALTDGTNKLSYTQLDNAAKKVCADIPSRSLAICVCSNTMASVIGYVGLLQKRVVPILVNEAIDKELFNQLVANYRPGYIWAPKDFYIGNIVYEYDNYTMCSTGEDAPVMNEALALMLTTSGSTGSPKFVRQTYLNIESNTKSIVEYLGIQSDDKAITTLPMSYTYGLSIIQSHLMAGACIVMTERTIFDKEFWNLLREQNVNTFGAVPYNYQMLDRLRFLRMELPSLRYITQAGGRLGEELHHKFAEGLRAKGQSLVVMYGATEATARMSYVPAEVAVEKAGSIGIAIPGGRFELIDIDNKVIEGSNTVGELIYYGDNVTMGYAECRDDLAKGDERNGRLETGDMAMRDEDGYYFVVGRKKRFLKIYGNRVNLVEIEELLAKAGYETACVGEDDHMRIYTTAEDTNSVVAFISEKTGLNKAAFTAIHIDAIPHNESGKVLYSKLQ